MSEQGMSGHGSQGMGGAGQGEMGQGGMGQGGMGQSGMGQGGMEQQGMHQAQFPPQGGMPYWMPYGYAPHPMMGYPPGMGQMAAPKQARARAWPR